MLNISCIGYLKTFQLVPIEQGFIYHLFIPIPSVCVCVCMHHLVMRRYKFVFFILLLHSIFTKSRLAYHNSLLQFGIVTCFYFELKVNIPVIHFQGNYTNECNRMQKTGLNRKVKNALLLDLWVDRRLLFPRCMKNIPQVKARPSQMPSDADEGEGANHGAITQTSFCQSRRKANK